jgi:hypothetical protein
MKLTQIDTIKKALQMQSLFKYYQSALFDDSFGQNNTIDVDFQHINTTW